MPGIEPRSSLRLAPGRRVFSGDPRFEGWPPWYRVEGVDEPQDILTEARAKGLRDWFVAGYGPTRLLPSPGKASRELDPMQDRLRPLFGEALIGTGFMDLLSPELGRAFAKLLHEVGVEPQGLEETIARAIAVVNKDQELNDKAIDGRVPPPGRCEPQGPLMEATNKAAREDVRAEPWIFHHGRERAKRMDRRSESNFDRSRSIASTTRRSQLVPPT